MRQSTAGQVLINQALPKDLRKGSYQIDKKSIKELMREIADKRPEEYKDIIQKIMDTGRLAAQASGNSLSLKSLIPTPEVEGSLEALRSQVDKISNSDKDEETKRKEIIDLVGSQTDSIRDAIFSQGLAEDNPFAIQAASGSRGKPAQLQQLVAGDMLVTDHRDQVLPTPILRGYSEGLNPDEYFAASFGSRKGLVDTKLCLAGDTLVEMSDQSYRQLIDISPGEEVTAIDFDGRRVPSKVKAIHDNGYRLCYKYRFKKISYDSLADENLLQVIATDDHKFLSEVLDPKDVIKGNYVTKQSSSLERFWEIQEKGSEDNTSSSEINCNIGITGEAKLTPLSSAKFTYDWPSKLYFAFQSCVNSDDEEPDYPEYCLDRLLLVDRLLVGMIPTFDLEIEHPASRFVLANGLISSNSTQRSGFLAKLLAQSAHRGSVTKEDCGTNNGMSVDVGDGDNVGAVLARPAGPFKAGKILSSKDIKKLEKEGIKDVSVRSPITCQSDEGFCAKCAGARSKGRLPDIGDNIGIPASQAISERISQSALSSKHGGGSIGSQGVSKGGFDKIQQLVNVPSKFQDEAPVTEEDGIVRAVEEAPQGGNYVNVGSQQLYVPPEQNVTVKPGQNLEAGDSVSDGIPNPSRITRLKGIGEGRKYFTNAFREAIEASGSPVHRRNVEAIAKGLVNHVEITSPEGFNGFMPGDIVSYDSIKNNYQPREGTQKKPPYLAKNMYLERPTMHYTLGTRVTPRVAEDMKKQGIEEIEVHEDSPPFEPKQVRALENALRDPNWMTRLGGSYLQKGFEEAVQQGRTAETQSTSYIPGLAEATNLGKDLSRTGKY